MYPIHTLGGWLLFFALLATYPAGMVGLFQIWRPSSAFALAGRFLYSFGVVFGWALVAALLSSTIPCQSRPCG